MKLNKYSIIAFALSAAMFLAGCEFSGTKASFKGDEETRNNVVHSSVVMPGAVYLDTSSTIAFDKKAELSFVIVSNGALNEETIDEACNFCTVSNASDDAFCPSIDYQKTTKTLKSIDVVLKPENSDGKSETGDQYDFTSTFYEDKEVILTLLTYEFDTTTLKTDQLALFVDAEILREKSKKYVLNYDNNEECGEQSDSFIGFYAIDNSGGSLTEITSNISLFENTKFAPKFYLYGGSAKLEPQVEGGVKYRFDLTAPSYQKADGSYVYGEGFADAISEIYSFRFLPLGEKKWKEVPVHATYDKDNHRYTVKSDDVATGTQCWLAIRQQNDITWDAAKERYGNVIVPRLGYSENEEWYDCYTVSYFYTSEPDYIVNDPDATDGVNNAEFTVKPAAQYNEWDIANLQAGLVEVTTYEGKGLIKISIKQTYKDKNIRFGAIDGFVVTTWDSNTYITGSELDFEIVEEKTERDEKGITAVYIQLDNQYYDMSNLSVWAGYDTTIAKNNAHQKQVHFGNLGAVAYNPGAGALPGYVAIY